MPKITELFAWVVADKDENDEGVPAMKTDIGPLPLMGSDTARAQSLRPFAQQAANMCGKPVKLIRSTGLEIVEVVEPAR